MTGHMLEANRQANTTARIIAVNALATTEDKT